MALSSRVTKFHHTIRECSSALVGLFVFEQANDNSCSAPSSYKATNYLGSGPQQVRQHCVFMLHTPPWPEFFGIGHRCLKWDTHKHSQIHHSYWSTVYGHSKEIRSCTTTLCRYRVPSKKLIPSVSVTFLMRGI